MRLKSIFGAISIFLFPTFANAQGANKFEFLCASPQGSDTTLIVKLDNVSKAICIYYPFKELDCKNSNPYKLLGASITKDKAIITSQTDPATKQKTLLIIDRKTLNLKTTGPGAPPYKIICGEKPFTSMPPLQK